ncbi:MAG: GNAT family N-acetyltransferase [Tenericutes bacterium HGW-Tenericutes-1]|jgi:ribosomal-protein-alanine N-acetyltransferase|nr:MAG: GNAT family N-acetyltransferase [Tenericutes bacterium HGW-Tenericutes-3]PKL01351.1 MAG: GNAT family N-acetyltransferase [Tenericutes bacterium HGW-Tenericutes-1]
MNKPFEPFPTLETERLLIRRIEQYDSEDIFSMRSHPMMHLFTDTLPDTLSIQASNYISRIHKGFSEQIFFFWGIELKSIKKLIGTVCIWSLDELANSGELGYGLHPDFQRKGYMQEALIPVIHFGLDTMNLKVLEAYTEINNLRSIHLLEKLNFHREKIIIEKGQNKHQDFHMAVYSISR